MLKKTLISTDLGTNQATSQITTYLLFGFILVYKSVTICQE
jgi:hypothetical protein